MKVTLVKKEMSTVMNIQGNVQKENLIIRQAAMMESNYIERKACTPTCPTHDNNWYSYLTDTPQNNCTALLLVVWYLTFLEYDHQYNGSINNICSNSTTLLINEAMITCTLNQNSILSDD